MYQPKTISAKEMVEEGAYPVFGANGIIGSYDQFNHQEPQLLITCRGATCGSVNVSLPKSWVTGNAMVVRPKDASLDLKYLEYYFRGGIDISKAITGAAQPQITRANLAPLEIQFPTSIKEQRWIVAVLDEAFAAIATATANAEKNLANADALYESALRFAFTEMELVCPSKRIGEIAFIKGGKRLPKGQKLQFEPTPFPYLTVGDFNNDGTIDESGIRYVPIEVQPSIKRYIIHVQDLYISIAGTIGRTGIVPESLDGAQLTENACRLVFDPNVSNRFVYQFTRSPSFKDQAIEQTRTTAQPKLALSRLEQICLPIPTIGEQVAWATKFEAIAGACQELRNAYAQKIEELAALKQSLLQRAFTGKLATAPAVEFA